MSSLFLTLLCGIHKLSICFLFPPSPFPFSHPCQCFRMRCLRTLTFFSRAAFLLYRSKLRICFEEFETESLSTAHLSFVPAEEQCIHLTGNGGEAQQELVKIWTVLRRLRSSVGATMSRLFLYTDTSVVPTDLVSSFTLRLPKAHATVSQCLLRMKRLRRTFSLALLSSHSLSGVLARAGRSVGS